MKKKQSHLYLSQSELPANPERVDCGSQREGQNAASEA